MQRGSAAMANAHLTGGCSAVRSRPVQRLARLLVSHPMGTLSRHWDSFLTIAAKLRLPLLPL
ncbi:MAG: hypothetical protein JO316_20625 [Abitibacteriaceae bacterium]|nr:hypothetical protein [Abditibacteriaceae bacterium]